MDAEGVLCQMRQDTSLDQHQLVGSATDLGRQIVSCPHTTSSPLRVKLESTNAAQLIDDGAHVRWSGCTGRSHTAKSSTRHNSAHAENPENANNTAKKEAHSRESTLLRISRMQTALSKLIWSPSLMSSVECAA